jgi:PIN domain nuclease of toxin-antitoxin system
LNLLLDTNAFLWWLAATPRLGRQSKLAIADPANAVWVSAATVWEIAIKTSIGRLDMGEPPEQCVPREMARYGFRSLPIEFKHALAVRGMPLHHRDPFDRLLIAQAQIEGLQILTSDRVFAAYGVPTIAADT